MKHDTLNFYLVELENEDRFIVARTENLRRSIDMHFGFELQDFMCNPDGTWDGHLYDPQIGQDYKITATPLECYGVKK